MILRLSLLLALVLGTQAWALEKKIAVGLVAGFSGSDPNTAREYQRGWKVFEAVHPDFSARIQLEQIDTRGHAETGHNAVREAIDKGVSYFVGFHDSNEAMAVTRLIEDRKALLITPFSSNPKVTEGMKQTFRACPSDSMHGQVLAKFFLKELKLKATLVLANRDSLYSQGLAQIFVDELKKSKRAPRIVREFYGKDDLNLEWIKKLATAEQVDSVLVPDHVARAGLIIGKLAEYSPEIVVLGGDGLGGRRILEAAATGKFPRRLYYTYPWDERWAAGLAEAKPFIESYRKLFPGEPISAGAALTYDSLLLLKEGLKAAPADGTTVARAIEKARLKGTGGSLGFKGEEHSPTRPILIMTLKDGKHEVYRRITP